MISGEKVDGVAAALLSILIAVAFAVSPAQSVHGASSADFELAALMRKLSEVVGADGGFTERKYFSPSDEPLRLSRDVVYQSPGCVRNECADPTSHPTRWRGH